MADRSENNQEMNIMYLRRKARNVLSELAKEQEQPPEPDIEQDNEEPETWFEKLDLEEPSPIEEEESPRRGAQNGTKYRNYLTKVDDRVYDELTQFVRSFKGRDAPPKQKTQYGLERIGAGCFRCTYQFTEDSPIMVPHKDKMVLKVTKESESWCNEEEARVWSMFKGTEMAKHFVPVIDIGPSGRWVLMKKVDADTGDFDDARDIEEKIRSAGWMHDDIKADNIGQDENGNIVLLDYGYEWKKRR